MEANDLSQEYFQTLLNKVETSDDNFLLFRLAYLEQLSEEAQKEFDKRMRDSSSFRIKYKTYKDSVESTHLMIDEIEEIKKQKTKKYIYASLGVAAIVLLVVLKFIPLLSNENQNNFKVYADPNILSKFHPHHIGYDKSTRSATNNNMKKKSSLLSKFYNREYNNILAEEENISLQDTSSYLILLYSSVFTKSKNALPLISNAKESNLISSDVSAYLYTLEYMKTNNQTELNKLIKHDYSEPLVKEEGDMLKKAISEQ
ncbi:hypothetical protein ACE193_21125 [Bernardetia sp. OM2101]|uniref:hypothetical protein n=1 Tax=Bernardetia sp. OM2101 TaxID=3344876 RepID=UPI0035D1280C